MRSDWREQARVLEKGNKGDKKANGVKDNWGSNLPGPSLESKNPPQNPRVMHLSLTPVSLGQNCPTEH